MSGPSSSFDRAMAMWREIDFPLLAVDEGALASYLDALRALYSNGRVVHRAFAIPPHADFDLFLGLGQLHEAFFFGRFWLAPSVRAALPYRPHDENLLDRAVFAWTQRVELPGTLAAALVRGGAYHPWRGSARDAMALGQQAAEALLAGDFERGDVFVAQSAWSDFFHDAAWDGTWLTVDLVRRRIDVILATDTD